MVGDPLVVKNLSDYLEISFQNHLKVNITTTANILKEEMFETLSHDAIKQVNFSINSYNANSHKKSLEEYLEPIFHFCSYVLQHQKELFVNLRIWNLDNIQSAKAFNKEVFDRANTFFGCDVKMDEIYANRPKNIKIARKIFFNFDDYFNWPSLNNAFVSTQGFCYGLESHIAILSSGEVVPCCLDKDGIIPLGNLKEHTLKEILSSPKAVAIKNGFAHNNVVEELCQKCDYRTRFDTKENHE